MFSRLVQRKRPRRSAFLAIAATTIVAIGLITSVVLALVSDSGTYNLQVDNKNQSTGLVDIGNASVEYIGSSASNQASGTGLFDPFVRLQGSPTEKGYNTNGAVAFDTKSGQWTHAILANAIPLVDCDGSGSGTALCWELFVDINEGNNAKHISLNEVEVWFTTNPNLVGYADPAGFPAGTATQVYDFTGSILINDVNQGSGRGDLRYLIPVANIDPWTSTTWFVLYSKWGTTSVTYNSEGGFEEWKVRKAPNISILKTANPAGPVNAGSNIGFDITVSNTGAAAASNVTITDPLPAGAAGVTGGDLNWSLNPPFTGCTISGAIGSQVLNCSFTSIAAGGTVGPIHLTSATTAADCGTVTNTATVFVGGASGGTSTASVTVNCGALMILKNSTKGGAVNNAGAVFSVDGPDANTDPDFSVTDDTTTAAPDEDADVGEVCVSGLAPGSYTINETTAPDGYGDAGQTNVAVTVVNGTNCTTSPPAAAATATFTNSPLYDLQVNFRDGGSGETSATISCTNTGTADTTAATGWDTTNTFLDEGAPETVVCTINVDP